MNTPGQGHNSAYQVFNRVFDIQAPIPVKLLAVIRIRHAMAGGKGRLHPEDQMALASVSPSTYKRHSRAADDIIRTVGFDDYFKLGKVTERIWGGKRPLIKAVIDASDRETVFDKDGYACVKCGSPDDLTVDHILSEKKGGASELSNYQTLCRPCNSRKGAR
jgi:hypothetical protein